MEIAFGVLGWTPETLRTATIRHLLAGFEGWREANGAAEPEGVSRAELDALMQRYPDEKD